MTNYTMLAGAVILRAMQDMVSNPNFRFEKHKQKQAMKWKEESREFLTKPNEDLAFWCEVGEIDMNAIVRRGKRLLAGEPLVLGETPVSREML